jgi:phosphoribosyl-ATP pyrophosphohydrolase
LAGGEASYTKKLLADRQWLASKLHEEAGELAAASTPEAITAEAADLLYFLQVTLQRGEVPLPTVEAELDRRALQVRRRPGLPKPEARR